jgi:hypothetical protein
MPKGPQELGPHLLDPALREREHDDQAGDEDTVASNFLCPRFFDR